MANEPAIRINEPFEEELLSARPPEELEIWEHGEKYCSLPKDSAIKGKWLYSMAPYAAMVFDAMKFPHVYSVSIVKSAQSGISVLMQVIVGYYTHQIPRPIMVVLADQETAEYVSDMRYKHMFEEDQDLCRLIDRRTWTHNRMGFVNGGYIEMGWASSVAKMGTRSMCILILDEIDKPGYSMTTREAAAIKLAENRTKTFPGKLHFKLSTPTDELGNITIEITQAADIVFDWHAPCPHCGQYQPLNWWNPQTKNFWFPESQYRGMDGRQHTLGCVVWEGGREATNQQVLETSRYQCGECGALWTTEEKNEAVRKGVGVPDHEPTGYERQAGVRINELLSLFDSGKLENMVSEWVSIFRIEDREQRDKSLQDFVNSKLGEPFRQVTLSVSISAVLSARCALAPQIVPAAASALVCGIDVQKYGFWFVVRAFAADYTSWMIHNGYLSGEEQLEDLLFNSSYPQDGSESPMRIWRAGMDTGGGETDYEVTMTERTYLWLARNRRRGVIVWPTKGGSNPMPGRILKMANKIDKLPSGQALPFALQLVELNTFDLKAKFHRRLSYAIESNKTGEVIPGSAFLHSATDQQYANHILAEQRQRVKGVEKWVKVREGIRNDYLDCEVICHALADPEWPGGGANKVSKHPENGHNLPENDREKIEKSKKDWLKPRNSNWFGR